MTMKKAGWQIFLSLWRTKEFPTYRLCSRQSQNRKRIETTTDFIKAVEPLFKREREKKDMAKLFQALRIEVNHEMDALKEMLKSATEILKPGGRLSVITYHSLEDRIVKNVMKSGNSEGKSHKTSSAE